MTNREWLRMLDTKNLSEFIVEFMPDIYSNFKRDIKELACWLDMEYSETERYVSLFAKYQVLKKELEIELSKVWDKAKL